MTGNLVVLGSVGTGMTALKEVVHLIENNNLAPFLTPKSMSKGRT